MAQPSPSRRLQVTEDPNSDSTVCPFGRQVLTHIDTGGVDDVLIRSQA
jgi:hypothetical protein